MDAERLNGGRKKEKVFVTDRLNPNGQPDSEAALLARVYSLILNWGDETAMNSMSQHGDASAERTTPTENPAEVNIHRRQVKAGKERVRRNEEEETDS